jgi:hypothetical protein
MKGGEMLLAQTFGIYPKDVPALFVCLGLYTAAVASGIAGLLIGSESGNRVAGFWLGFLFGPFGLVIISFYRDQKNPEKVIERDERVRMKVRREMKNVP